MAEIALRIRKSAPLLGALSLLIAAGAAHGYEPTDWSDQLRKALAPQEPITVELLVQGDERAGLWPLKVELDRRPRRDGTHEFGVRVVEPFDLRGTTFWVESDPEGVQTRWVYLPALRRVRKLADDSPWVHPGLQLVFRLEELARSGAWEQAQVERVRADGREEVRVTHVIPKAQLRLEARFDPDRRVPTEVLLREPDGELQAEFRLSDYRPLGTDWVASKVEVRVPGGSEASAGAAQSYANTGAGSQAS